MKRGALVAVVVALAGAAVWWFVVRDKGGESASAELTAEQRIAQRKAARAAGRANTQPAAVGGIVVAKEDGAPIAGAVVSVSERSLDRGARAMPGQTSERIVTVTDANGRFRVDGLGPASHAIAVSARGFLPTRTSRLVLAAGDERTDLRYELARGGVEVRGAVTDIGGGPVAGATVAARKEDGSVIDRIVGAPIATLTDENGQYSLTVARGSYSIGASHTDYVESKKNVDAHDPTQTVDFQIVPGSIVTGYVLRSSDEAPVAGALVVEAIAEVEVSGVSLGRSSVTDNDGKFVLRGLSSGVRSLSATARGYIATAPVEVPLGIAEQVDDVIIYVEPSFTVSGFVVSEQDGAKPIAGVMVAAGQITPPKGAVARDPSADDGYFEIHGVRPGTYMVGAYGDGHAPNIFGTSVTVVDKDVDDVVVELSTGRAVSGRVSPAAVADIRLELDTTDFGFGQIPAMIASQLVRTSSAADGTFRVTGLPIGDYKIVARVDDGRAGSKSVELVSKDVTDLVVELEERAAVAGTVVDQRGKPVVGVEVAVRGSGKRRGFGSEPADNTDGSGTFEVKGLEPGDYTLVVREGWNEYEWADSQKLEDGKVAVKLEGAEKRTGVELVVKARDGVLTGTVVDSSGQPVPDAWVTAKSTDVREGAQPWFSGAQKPVLSGPDGDFEIRRLPHGTYDIEAEGYKGSARGTAKKVKTGGSATIKIHELGSLSGTVSLAGEPVTKFAVKVSGPIDRRVPTASKSGEYKVARLTPGKYKIEVTADRAFGTTEFELAQSQKATVDIELAALATLVGRVVDENGEPMAGLSIMRTGPGADPASMGMEMMTGTGPKTDDQGRFDVANVAPGKGMIMFHDRSAKSFMPIATESYEVKTGQRLDLGDIKATNRELAKDLVDKYGDAYKDGDGDDGDKAEEPEAPKPKQPDGE